MSRKYRVKSNGAWMDAQNHTQSSLLHVSRQNVSVNMSEGTRKQANSIHLDQHLSVSASVVQNVPVV